MVVLRGEGGVAVTQPVHHGAAGDDDGRKQGADAVLEGRKLQKGREKKKGGSQLKRKKAGAQLDSSGSSLPPGPPLATPHTAPGYAADTRGQSSGRGPLRSRWLLASTSSGPQTHSCPASLWCPVYSNVSTLITLERKETKNRQLIAQTFESKLR